MRAAGHREFSFKDTFQSYKKMVDFSAFFRFWLFLAVFNDLIYRQRIQPSDIFLFINNVEHQK